MAVLSWDEIRNRALKFQNEWKDETSENAESKTFWNEFFEVFGISRRRVATFEERVKIDGHTNFVDLLWRGTLLIEHKSKGKDLDKAYDQATNYFSGIQDVDLPQYVLVSDFEKFRLYDLDNGEIHQFELREFYRNIQLFSFIAGYEKHDIKAQDPVNIRAAEMMGKIHDSLQNVNYTGADLDTLLVRLVFCLFADDTGIFNKGLFRDFLMDNTKEDGSDLAINLQYLFEILDTPIEKRVVDDSIYSEFPYVNGSLFSKRLRTAVFNEKMRKTLIECSKLDWGKISPAIFGSMFQSAMDSSKRRSLGAHYTSEENIMKALKPLFLDGLFEEFNEIKNRKQQKVQFLEKFQNKLARLTFFDPACGSGNFLILAYREIRKLELEVLKEINYEKYGIESYQLDISLDFNDIVKCNVNQFYGIELDSFSAQIAQVALWIVDHQMNIEASLYFGQSYARLPLSEHADIVNGNALKINWNEVLDSRNCSYIIGNPPFSGSTMTSENKKEKTKELKAVFDHLSSAGKLDYVSGWFIKAAKYIQGKSIEVALVSTNSITQGSQVGPLWNEMIFRYKIKINFAYQTFEWTNAARGVAHVHCVIIGFANFDKNEKFIFDNKNNKSKVSYISPYLNTQPFIYIKDRNVPISEVPVLLMGNQPIDGGNYLFSEQEMNEFISKEPLSKKYFRPWYGSREFQNNIKRYCLFLRDCPPSEIAKMKHVRKIVENVRNWRIEQGGKTAEYADFPTQFRVTNEQDLPYLVIPEVSSQNRHYVPIGFLEPINLASNLLKVLPNADRYHFGILTSQMHNAWIREVSGRLKSDIRYSIKITYNCFVWPEVTENKRNEIIGLSKDILDIRMNDKNRHSTLAELYSYSSMDAELLKAHQKLDQAVDKAYRAKKFMNDSERVAYLFDLYKKNNE